MSTLVPDRDMIERLVAEVIGRLGGAASSSAAATAPATRAHPAAPAQAASAAPAAMDSSGSGAPAATGSAVVLPDRVITLALLERVAAGTRQVAIDPRAVVTPSARDHARDVGLAIVRTAAASGLPAAVRPFLVATAACAADPGTKAAAIARAVPGASRLPASGLSDVIAACALHAARDAARGILLTSRPAVAVILANRSASLRAVTGRDTATLAAHAAACAANLLIIDPATFSGGLDRLCADFATAATGPLPAELATAPAGCGCTSHPH